MINVIDRFQYLSKESSCHQGKDLIITQLSTENVSGNMLWHWPCFTWKLLLIPYSILFHKIFKLIFHKQSSCPKKYVLNTDANLLNTFLGNFLVLLEQQFCRTLVSSCFKGAVNLFSRSNKVFTQHLVNLVVLAFYFNYVPPFYCFMFYVLFYVPKWNRHFSSFLKVLTSRIYLLITAGSIYYFIVLEISAIRILLNSLYARVFRVPK